METDFNLLMKGDPNFLNDKDLLEWDAICAQAAEIYSKYMYAQKLYEGRSKDFLAALKFKLLKENEKSSQAELEMKARASDEWKIFRQEQMEWLKKAGKAQIAYDNAKRRWQTAQSILSYKKQEMNKGV